MPALDKQKFFKVMEAEGVALTYNDVRMETRASEVSPQEVDTTSRFSRHVPLRMPFSSAAMDTVTESAMAIALAKYGGIGIIHAGLTIDEQYREVRRVKLHLNGLIENPMTVYGSQTLQEVLDICQEKQFDFRSFPVLDAKEKFVGLLTQKDFDFSTDLSATVESVMTPAADITHAPVGTSIHDAYDTMVKNKKKKLPLLDSTGKIAGLYVFSDVSRIVNDNSGMYNVDKNGRLVVGAAVPTDETAVDRVRTLEKYLDVAVIDSAQGDSKYAFSTLKLLKEEFPTLDIVVGNVSTGESARRLAELGADGIKVGQGPGSICTTRIETGIGSPQVTAVWQCVEALKGLDVPVIADGGIQEPGDISIAIATGASSVMMGNMLAGTSEAPGNVIQLADGSSVKLYRGMGSPSALRDSAAARKRYGVGGIGQPLAEGVEATIAYKGSVTEMLDHYTKALRKSMSYIGAADIATHQKTTRFYRITNAGMVESRTHDI